jgi:MYXO-CTERM domain-containing protein
MAASGGHGGVGGGRAEATGTGLATAGSGSGCDCAVDAGRSGPAALFLTALGGVLGLGARRRRRD